MAYHEAGNHPHLQELSILPTLKDSSKICARFPATDTKDLPWHATRVYLLGRPPDTIESKKKIILLAARIIDLAANLFELQSISNKKAACGGNSQ